MKKMETNNNREMAEELQLLNEGLEQVLGNTSGTSASGQVVSEKMKESAMPKRKKQKRRIPLFIWIPVFLLLLAGGGAGTLYYLREQGREEMLSHADAEQAEITAPEDAVVAPDGKTVTYNGVTYHRNENVISILAMGVDTVEMVDEDDEGTVAGTSGQADTLVVGALNVDTGELNLINISRDSMVDVDLYYTNDDFARSEKMQICLAYAYGDGAHESCKNTAKAVSRLFYGIPIDAYISVRLPAISVLNDAIGGVEVDVLEDLSSKDPALTLGAHVLLRGNQAETYLRSRDSDGGPVDSNNARMARQKQYMISFMQKAISQIRSNLSNALTLYNAAQDYAVTNLDTSRVIYLASLAMQKDFTENNLQTIAGEVVMGEKYAEYYVDEASLYQTILDVYYVPEGRASETSEEASTES